MDIKNFYQDSIQAFNQPEAFFKGPFQAIALKDMGILIAVFFVLSQLLTHVRVFISTGHLSIGVVALVIAVASIAIGVAVMAGLLWAVGHFIFKMQKDFMSALKLVLFVTALVYPITAVSVVLPGIVASVLSLVTGVGFIYLMYLGCIHFLELQKKTAILTMAIAWGPLMVLGILVSVLGGSAANQDHIDQLAKNQAALQQLENLNTKTKGKINSKTALKNAKQSIKNAKNINADMLDSAPAGDSVVMQKGQSFTYVLVEKKGKKQSKSVIKVGYTATKKGAPYAYLIAKRGNSKKTFKAAVSGDASGDSVIAGLKQAYDKSNKTTRTKFAWVDQHFLSQIANKQKIREQAALAKLDEAQLTANQKLRARQLNVKQVTYKKRQATLVTTQQKGSRTRYVFDDSLALSTLMSETKYGDTTVKLALAKWK